MEKQQSTFASLQLRLKHVTDRIRGVVMRKYTGLYLHGRAGTSKTHTILTTLEALDADFHYHSGHITPVGLFDTFQENQDRVIVLDDVSSIFKSEIGKQFLLAALGQPHDSSGVRVIRYRRSRRHDIVYFTGGVIAISNLELNQHDGPVMAALKDRINVIDYDPTDAEMVALINHIAAKGTPTIPPPKCRLVADFLLSESKRRSIRPSVRLFVDKALKDYELWSEGECELDWKDLVLATLEERLVDVTHPYKELRLDDREAKKNREQRIALHVYCEFDERKDRIEEWTKRTGKSQSAFYRRIKELDAKGKLPPPDSIVIIEG